MSLYVFFCVMFFQCLSTSSAGSLDRQEEYHLTLAHIWELLGLPVWKNPSIVRANGTQSVWNVTGQLSTSILIITCIQL